MSMSLDMQGQGGHRVEQYTSPLKHEKEEQREEPRQAWPLLPRDDFVYRMMPPPSKVQDPRRRL
jgi:hypothetical protein